MNYISLRDKSWVSHDIRLKNQHIPTNCSQITRSWVGDFLSQAVLWNRWRNSVMLQRILKGLCVRKRMIPQAATWQEVRKQTSKDSFEKRVLTLAGGESGAPGVAPYAHHQRISHQVVAVVTLELQSMPSVQAEFLHFTVQHLFGADAATDHWQDRKTTGMWCQTCLMSDVSDAQTSFHFFCSLSALHTFTPRHRQAPRAIVQTGERLWADQLQPRITHIGDIVRAGLTRRLCILYCGRSPTWLQWGRCEEKCQRCGSVKV